MTITYTYIKSGVEGGIDMILRDSDQTWIPVNLDNRNYQEYLKWLEEGNQPALEIRGGDQ